MPDLTANPLRVVCPTCGADRDEECRGFDVPGLAVAHTARFPDTPTYGPSDRCDCGDPLCEAHGVSDAQPGFSQTLEAMTRHHTAHDAYRED